MSWFDAEKFCVQSGGHLASPTNQQVDNFLKTQLKQQTGNSNKVRWLGGIREKNNETWVWTDCSDKPFTEWPYGQPDNPKEKESCSKYTTI